MKNLKREEGIFTLEASFTLPIVLFSLLLMLMLSLYLYQQIWAFHVGTVTMERVTYNWDNSNKDWETGDYALGKYAPLYNKFTDFTLFYDQQTMEASAIYELQGFHFEIVPKFQYVKGIITCPIHLPLIKASQISMPIHGTWSAPVEFVRNADTLQFLLEEYSDVKIIKKFWEKINKGLQ